MPINSVQVALWLTPRGLEAFAKGETPHYGHFGLTEPELDMTGSGWKKLYDLTIDLSCINPNEATAAALRQIEEELATFRKKVAETEAIFSNRKSKLLAISWHGADHAAS